MKIIPIDGFGILITGPQQPQPVEVWHDELVTLTRLPRGRCLIPMRDGVVRVMKQGKVLAQADIAASRLPEIGGTFALHGAGTVRFWPFYGDLDEGVLAGEEPIAEAQGALDLASVGLPHRVMTVAVQVAGSRRVGPIRFYTYRPQAQPCPIRFEHVHTKNGPLAQLSAQLVNVPTLQVEVERHVRQTGKTLRATFEVTSSDDQIPLTDLLHGDRIDIRARAPGALAGADGNPVQAVAFQYKAVPEPRLEALGDEEPLESIGGLTVLEGDAVAKLMSPISSANPTWVVEYPVAGIGAHESLVQAVAHKISDVPADLATNPDTLAWWTLIIESHQDVEAAARLGQRGVKGSAQNADDMATALDWLEPFPAQVFHELNATGPADEIIAFQESLGLAQIDGDAAIDLAHRGAAALKQAVATWRDAIAAAELSWMDGALPPLQRSGSLDELAQQLSINPVEGLKELLERRRRIWQVVPSSADGHVDVEARQALLSWQLQRSEHALQAMAALLSRAGVSVPPATCTTLEDFVRVTGAMLRAAEPAIARLEGAPVSGSRLVEAAAVRAEESIEAIHGALRAWAGDDVPAAPRRLATQALERWSRRLITRAEVWATFARKEPKLSAWLLVLDGNGEPGAGRLARAMQTARERDDPGALVPLQRDLHLMEDAVEKLQADWQRITQECSAATIQALQLDEPTSWATLAERVDADLEAIMRVGSRLTRAQRAGRFENDLLALEHAAGRFASADDRRALRALLAYDNARQVVAGGDAQTDPVATLADTRRHGLMQDLRRRMQSYIGPHDASVLAALQAFPQVSGAKQLKHIIEITQKREETVEVLEKMHGWLDRLEASDSPWDRICVAVQNRVRPVRIELLRYMGNEAPNWRDLESPTNTIRWLHAMARGERDALTDSDPAVLPAGNRRLLEHALKQHDIWMP